LASRWARVRDPARSNRFRHPDSVDPDHSEVGNADRRVPQLEVEVSDRPSPLLENGSRSSELIDDSGNPSTASIKVSDKEDGHGFDITEVVTVVVSVASSAASGLVADAVRTAVGRVIRKVKARRSARTSGGAPEELRDLLDEERTIEDEMPPTVLG
jgi:hypothetical protein